MTPRSAIGRGLLLFCSMAGLLAGCGGGGGRGGGGPPPPPPPPPAPTSYTVGGSVSGLSGTLILQNNGGNNLTVSTNGAFTFPQSVSSGAMYGVTVATQPVGQTCSIANATGNATANITSVSVTCTSYYMIGGSVSGLSGSLALQNNGGDTLNVYANGPFTLRQPVNGDSTYNVTIATQPGGQLCTVAAASGVATSNVTSVVVTCGNLHTIGGSVSGLSSGAVHLRNNDSDDLTMNLNGPFNFTQGLPIGATYNVTIANQPPEHSCAIANASGTVTGNITSVAITCTRVYTLSGQVFGLKGPMVLRSNAAGDLNVAGNGEFTFATPVAAGVNYSVSILSHSALQMCNLSNGSGTANTNVVNLLVVCSDRTVTAALAYQPIKTFHFTWGSVTGATHYRLLENPDGSSGFAQAGVDIASNVGSYDHLAPLYARINARYIVQACDADICIDSNTLTVAPSQLTQAIGYFKASNVTQDAHFGDSLALSADGSTLAVGNWGEDSSATGINGNQGDVSATSRGAVYLFARTGLAWTQQAYIKPSNTSTGYDLFGHSVALSANGNTLVVGAPGESGGSTGINGDQNDKSAYFSGAVYAFARSDGTWSQQAYIKASNTDAGDQFGQSIALSADGDTLAVGAIEEASNATGINGNQSNNMGDNNGAVYLFARSGGTWTQQAYIKGSNTRLLNQFGHSLALSSNGNTLAVGTPYESSTSTGINGDQSSIGAYGAGAVYVFLRASSTWTQQAYIKASNTQANDYFGWDVALSADGSTLAVGAWQEDSLATGIDGNQSDDPATTTNSGAVYAFTRAGSTWTQQAYLKPSNTLAAQAFGNAVALSADGSRLAVGAWGELSAGIGLDGAQTVEPGGRYGAVYVFERSASSWAQQTYVKASNTTMGDSFGSEVALSADGNTMAVAAAQEDSASTGINGDQDNDPVTYFDSGAVYIY